MGEILQLLWTRQAFFFELFLQHLLICSIAIVMACFIGISLGISAAERKQASGIVMGTANFVYTIPSISMLGFLIPLSGIGNTTAIIALTIYGLLPMVRATYTGLTNVDPLLVEAARGMGSTPRQLLWKIKMPLALPVIVSGLRNMVVMTIALAGIASFVGAGGLGVAIYRGITLNNTAMTVAGSLLIAILALASDALIGAFAKLLAPGAKRNRFAIGALGTTFVAALLVPLMVVAFQASGATVHIATKPMTEQYIMGEILKQKIEAETDLKVQVTHGVGGGTSNIQPGMEKGDFDIYPEYTGTGWAAVLKNDSNYAQTDFPKLNQQYQSDYDMEWITSYGFQNTYGIAVPDELAKQYNLKTIADLTPIADQLVFGAEPDFFERLDGYKGLTSAYRIKFGNTKDIDVGLKYEAIHSRQIQAMPIFTTDGQLAGSGLTVLRDNLGYYPAYDCMNVVRSEILRQYPQLREILESLDGTIDEETMISMNSQVENDGATPAEVAAEFLAQLEQTKGATK
ncbi:ABC transporter permease/substrate-binding protein [Arcanobacterium buesumense]|uniref:ABC transporter permease/substrate-binding protein n=1 Tax=Arcanobacterium buesumense TaxID=2722751 RepID=UPI001B3ADCB7|nr:ABC transporter permease/substrate-binding protein [Arcanobacterium buesumense]